MKNFTKTLVLTFLFSFSIANAAIRYVKPTATGSGDGSTWTNASADLQAIINALSSGDEVWVAAGTYLPTVIVPGNVVTDNRGKSFQMKSGVSVYGGFNGSETLLTQRNWTTNPTILSGDLDNNDNPADFSNHANNSYHVVFTNNPTATTNLDGFTIKGGNADNTAVVNLGFVSSTWNLVGAGVLLRTAGINFKINNVNIANNNATDGGGIFNSSSNPTLTNVSITNNRAASSGGGIYNDLSNPTLTNVTIANNSAISNGGGIYNNQTNSTLKNTIVWDNISGGTAGIFNNVSTPTITYSNIQGLAPAGTNISTNPLFVNSADPDGPDNIFMTADDGLRLGCNSPCFNRGTNIGITSTDILGNPRTAFTTADMGAYESPIYLTNQSVVYVNKNATGLNNGTSWANAYINLQDGINACGAIEVWVVSGTYLPTVIVPGNFTTDNRGKSFQMKSGVSVYGGFNGTETTLSARNWTTNPTILSGDLDSNDNPTDFLNHANNSYHVVLINNPTATANLEGFTIKGGNANNSTIVDLGFINGQWNLNGGGVLSRSGSNIFKMNNVIIVNNNAYRGGGIYNAGSNPTLTNVTIANNSTTDDGGGIYNASSSPTLTNVTISNNSSNTSGGGIFNTSSNPILKNTIVWGNTAGGGVQGISSPGLLANRTYCNIQGLTGGATNFSNDPLFIDNADPDGADNIFMTADDGLRLGCNSPCYNTGDPATNANDILNNPRFGGRQDMGAYESQVGLTIPTVPTVTTPIFYAQNAAATTLTATSGGSGLFWYTAATGGTGTTTAPTPVTTTVGSITYYVSSTNAGNCESARVPIVVTVALPATHLNFDGINNTIDFVALPTTATGIPTGNSNYTIEAWINPSDIGSTRGIVGWGTYGTTNQANALRLTNDGIMNYWWGNDLAVIFAFPLNTWSHVAATYDGTTRKIYVNGAVIGQDTPTGHNVTTTNNVTIGKTIASAQNFEGGIDEVRIWNIARTATEIFGSKN